MTLYINYVKVDWHGQKKVVRYVQKFTEPNEVLYGLKTETGWESDDWAKWGVFDENAEVRVEWTC